MPRNMHKLVMVSALSSPDTTMVLYRCTRVHRPGFDRCDHHALHIHSINEKHTIIEGLYAPVEEFNHFADIIRPER